MIARDADHSLHERILNIDGVTEHDDIAAVHVLVGKDMLGDRPAGCIRQLIHEQMIANEERVFHGAGRDHKCLN